jgi:putative transposase
MAFIRRCSTDGRSTCSLGSRRIEAVFASGAKASVPAEDRQSELFEQIGRFKMELEWLKKKLPPSVESKRALAEPDHRNLSVRRQCDLLGLSRASLYYEALPETAENLRLMGLIDKQYTSCPFYGSRRIKAWLASQGEAVNRKRVQRLLRLMGLEAIYPKPRLSANRNHKVYPYLLRNVAI